MAAGGRVYLFGDGSNRINPIHGADLANVCVDAFENPESQIDVGGPEVFSYREIAELAFDVLNLPEKITCVPRSVVAATVGALRWLTPAKVYGPVEFMASVMTMDVIGEMRGKQRLREHFRQRSKAVSRKAADESEQSPGLTKHHP